MTGNFSDLDGVFLYVEGLVGYMLKTKHSMISLKKKLFERARQTNIKFNKIKCLLRV